MSNVTEYFSFKDCRLREVQDADINALVALINEAYSYQDEAKGEPRTNPAHLHGRVAETDFYVITHGDEIIGCVYTESKDTALHFGLLTVVPAWRGTGLAAAIMAAIEDYAKMNDYKTLELDYMSLAPWLKKYYEQYGFRETGQIQKWGQIDLIRMKKNLLLG